MNCANSTCGQPFAPKTSRQIYCTPPCRAEGRLRLARKQYAKPPKIDKNMAKEFLSRPW